MEGRSVYLRYPELHDFEVWADLRKRSRAFLERWEPTWPADDLTRSAFRRRVRRYQREVRDDCAYPYFVFRKKDDMLLGGCTLSHIRRGVAQACALGYWIGEPYAGQGYMSDAVRALSATAFEELGLHRIEAATVPSNEASQRVLRRCGFQQEGVARRYLKINGIWQDHVLFALLDDDPRPQPVGRDGPQN